MATSDFEVALFNATNSAGSSEACDSDLELIAEQSLTREGLARIVEVVYSRLASKQTDKWRRVLKTLRLVEYLFEGGSIAFCEMYAELFKELTVRFLTLRLDEPDQQSRLRASAKRIIEFCDNPAELARLRERFSSFKNRIVASGNESDLETQETASKSKQPMIIDKVLSPLGLLSSIKGKESAKATYFSVHRTEDDFEDYFGAPKIGTNRKEIYSTSTDTKESVTSRSEEEKYDISRFVKKTEGSSVKEVEDLIGLEAE